ncbi:MAG: cadherin-like beta sandwich domain-containing protein, partial [Treponema sp.]|nr:cadherin-like beta sandwich domain-containing protein [Treponema sp.]
GEDKYASSNANLAGADGIKIGGGAVPDYNPATYTYAIYKSANSAETPALTIAGEPGQQIEAALNGNHVASGSALQLGLGVNSLVIAVTAPDGVTKQTYTVSYTYHYDTQWYVSENGDDDSGDGTTGLPYKTVGKALGEIETVYANASGWPGGASEPVTARINITGAIDESVDTTGKNLPPILLMGSESGADEINVESSLDKPVLTIDANTTVILGKGLTLTSNMEKRGVYVSGDFIMNGGTISENTGDYGGGVYVSGAAASFTMNGGTISENIGKFNGGGVYVSGGAFTMNGGTISGNSTNSNNFGGGVYVTSGSFTMNGGIISDNKADNGGGVYVTSNSAFTMNGGTISDNKADNGGGVCLKPNPDGNEKQNFTMNGGTISGNSATSMGGGVYAIGGISSNDTSHIIMEGGTVSGNTSSRDGGGVYVTYNNGIFTMKGGTISGNTSNSNISSNYGGGGVAVSEGGSFDMSGGTISGNSASNGFGGGVCVYGDNAVFTMHEGGIINGNTAKVGGGGVCVYGGNAVFTMHEGGIINGNSDNYSGGGVFVTSSATFIMSGGTISGNTGDYGGGVAVTNGASTFIMSGGTISGNSATSMGGGVYFLSGDSLIMSGGAVIHIDNPVYLSNNQVITLAAPPLTANPAANIEYPTASGTQVLADDISTVDNDITADGNYKKFWLNDASNEIDEDGKIK